MIRKSWQILIVVCLALALYGGVVTLAQGMGVASSPAERAPRSPVGARTAYTYTTAITVTSTGDEGGKSQTCTANPPCTLRKAINEARLLANNARPVLIAFDIPTTDPGYDPTHQVWVIALTSGQSDITFIFRDFGTDGQVIVDGETQPIGRDLAEGPRIILRGDNDQGVFTLTGGNNIIRGLAFQGFGDRVISVPGTSNNLIEDNLFGLTITGTEIYLRDPDDAGKGSGETGIYVQSGGNNNTIQNNILTGFDQGAIALDGDDSFLLNNTIGTRADGTIPAVRPERLCRPNARYHNWFAGAGVQVYGHRNTIKNNRIVGMLYYSDDPLSTPEDALSVTGDGHIVQNNVIGVDAGGQPFGVCGEGIYVGGSFGGHSVRVLSNTVVGAHGAAGIFVAGGQFGYDLNGITVQHNVITASTAEAFAFGDLLPSTLRLFNPAQVVTISGTTVTGTSGLNSPCATCTIELFLDEIDTVTETQESLAVVVADGNGNWTATLPRPLAITEGIRTASTTASDGQITHPSGVYSAGMTTRISTLYVQPDAPAPTPAPTPALDPPLPIPAVTYGAPPTRPVTYNTVITVTSAADPDDSQSYTCYRDLAGAPGPAPDGLCTLRRAIVEASNTAELTPTLRPILIRFDIPTTSTQYDGATGVWVIQLYDTSQLTALPTLGSTDVNLSGRFVIDGWTQPDYDGLRANAPRIIIRGADAGKGGLVINGEHNVIRGLAFQRFKNILSLNHGGNTVEDCWFGLTADGQGVYLRDPAFPEEGSGDAGIAVAVKANNNLFQRNVFLGLTGAAINLEGSNDNHLLNNAIGTRADGTIDAASVAPGNICDPTATTDNWFGGAGFNVRGNRNRVISNTFVGLLLQGSALQTPPDAISIPSGQDQDNLIQGNRIGQDATGALVWTCGRGVDLSGRYTYILSNTIIGAHREGIFLTSGLIRINGDMMRGNVISGTATAIDFGDLVPEELRVFVPARVTVISGTEVSGIAGDACPYCWVDVYLDDDDNDIEATAYLGSALADANGDWSLTLPAPLEKGQGLRTISTIRNYGVIQYFEAGTSSKLSALYREQTFVYLPLVLR